MANHDYERFLFSERLLADFIRKGVQGRFYERQENVPVFYRATVLAVDVEGGKLENPNAAGNVSHTVNGQTVTVAARSGPENPRNSIKARILTEGLDQFVEDTNLRVYWPFFSDHMAVPVKPGEHVYVVFEDSEFKHGLWINKVPGHEGTNLVVGESMYKANQTGQLALKFGIGNEDTSQDPVNTDRHASESGINNLELAKKFGLGE